MKVLNSLILFGFVFFLACVNGKTQTSNYKSISEEKLSGQIEYVFSPDSSYVMSFVEIKGTAKHPQNNIKYIVHDLKTDKVVYEDALDNGSVSFYNDHAIQIIMIPGIMREGQSSDDFTYVYDLKTKEKKTLTELKN
ncbi:hypothetical protein JMN32_01920 [Fulvivirga sp. 29W222]|uniref:Lipoprotein n=1 Tax=Fulvivirga marina TaxID=2494733 RepID=A0A937FY34_9BACT|nr:hypothetical protein [Fulvivirga marina]MBL6445046.1 hypothetical protein [Fulvivirga marina]